MPFASPFDRLIWFGDSLTDESTIHDLTERTTIVTLPSESAGYGEAFTNGQVHAAITSDLLGVTDDNYAVGYGHALGSLTLEDFALDRFNNQIPGLDVFQPGAAQEDLDFDLYFGAQIQRYLADAQTTDPVPDSAAAFNIGLNDYSEFTPTSALTAPAEAAALVAAVVGTTIQGAAAVAATGVETVIFYTLPNFRLFPASAARPEEILALGDQIVAAHNAGLAQGAALLEFAGINVEFVDFNRLAAELMADPETFGFRADLFGQPMVLGTGANATLVELPDGSYEAYFPQNPNVAGIDPDQLAFKDFIHPSAATHGVLGVFSAESLISETFFFGDGDDNISGTNGKDLVLAGAGDDTVRTYRGHDVVLAGLGEDTVSAGSGSDIVAGGAGDDTLWGGRGSDVVADGAGNDHSWGGSGTDLLIDGSGCDVLNGGKGSDAFVLVDPALRGQPGEGSGGMMYGGSGWDTAYLILGDATRAAVEAELVAGARLQTLDAIDLATQGVEHFVFLSPEDDIASISTTAPIDEADLWGLI